MDSGEVQNSLRGNSLEHSIVGTVDGRHHSEDRRFNIRSGSGLFNPLKQEIEKKTKSNRMYY